MAPNNEIVESVDLLVNRARWTETKVSPREIPALREGEVLLKIERFALTANNISYAAVGDLLGYWKFFPANDPWGRVPAMGFAEVSASRHPGVLEGTRVFGFFPMSRYLVIEPGKVTPAVIIDNAEHRREISAVYNEYRPVDADPFYEPDLETRIMLLRGLFMTSFLVDDFLEDNGFFGSEALIVASASSKTAIALAHCSAKRTDRPTIGLTSERNVAFVESLGLYDQILTYDAIESLPPDRGVALVDMAGSADVISRLHHHHGANMKHTCLVGGTHWEAGGPTGDLPGATPEFFFAPTQIQKRSTEWGPDVLQNRMGESWKEFAAGVPGWLEVVERNGPEAVQEVFAATAAGEIPPSKGQIVSMWD